jgi:hypothetical protein
MEFLSAEESKYIRRYLIEQTGAGAKWLLKPSRVSKKPLATGLMFQKPLAGFGYFFFSKPSRVWNSLCKHDKLKLKFQ